MGETDAIKVGCSAKILRGTNDYTRLFWEVFLGRSY